MGRFHAEDPGELINCARLDAGMTQAELACQAGLSKLRLALLESGRSTVVPAMLDRVLEAADYRPNLALERNYNLLRKLAANLGLRDVRVFGSVARGEDGFDSDIDLLLTPDENVTLFDIAYFGEEVRQITGFPADVIVDNESLLPGSAVLEEAIRV